MKFSTTLKTRLKSERIVAFRVCLVEICHGNILAGLFLAQALYWTERTTDPDGWFYKTRKGWQSELGLTRHELDRVRSILRSEGFLEERLRGRTPPTVHYRLDQKAIEFALMQLAESLQVD